MQKFTDKQKGILYLSLIFMMISTGMQLDDFYAKQDSYTISYEYVNIKDMSQAKIKNKVNHTTIQTKIEEKETQEQGAVEEIELEKKVEEVPLTETQETEEIKPKEIWHLPIEIGQITQYPHSGHVAYDMTSYRKMDEVIHPIANGKISGIYTDSAGALIVTVLHEVDGVKYTSQYVHLSRYADDLYVGKEVTINDSLGQMGTTGFSTGVHLHVTVLDCALFDPNDTNCADLNGWYNYAEKRLSENFYGLGVLVYVPDSWYNFNKE